MTTCVGIHSQAHGSYDKHRWVFYNSSTFVYVQWCTVDRCYWTLSTVKANIHNIIAIQWALWVGKGSSARRKLHLSRTWNEIWHISYRFCQQNSMWLSVPTTMYLLVCCCFTINYYHEYLSVMQSQIYFLQSAPVCPALPNMITYISIIPLYIYFVSWVKYLNVQVILNTTLVIVMAANSPVITQVRLVCWHHYTDLQQLFQVIRLVQAPLVFELTSSHWPKLLYACLRAMEGERSENVWGSSPKVI